MTLFSGLEKVTKQGRKVTPKIAQNRVLSSKKSLSENASKLGPIFDTSEGAKSFKSVVNSSKIAWSPVLKKWSKWVPFWTRFGGQNRCYTVFLEAPKNNKKQSRFLDDLGSQNEVQNRSKIVHFLTLFPEPCSGGSAGRFLIDF